MTVYEEDGRARLFTKSGTTYVPPAGVFETLVKNANSTFTLTRHNQVKVNYAAIGGTLNGKFTSMVDSNGNTVTPTYNASGELTKVTEASGRELTIVNTSGRITRVTSPNNLNYDFAYDATTNDLITITFPRHQDDSACLRLQPSHHDPDQCQPQGVGLHLSRRPAQGALPGHDVGRGQGVCLRQSAHGDRSERRARSSITATPTASCGSPSPIPAPAS